MNSTIIVLGFYKYIKIKNLEELRDILLFQCQELNIKGNILLAKEGVNASISGTLPTIFHIKNYLINMPEFSDLFFKEERTFEHPFKKMKVKIKDEIVTFNLNVDPKKSGKHISSQEMENLYDKDSKLKDNIVILDVRNDYEYQIGKFKEAIHLNINVFREFKKKLNRLKNQKNKKIVMYCTGGIRCEKASAYMKSQGFNDVNQLNQGIINYGNEQNKIIWEGKCFVFDKRMFSSINNEGKSISNCLICKKNSDFQRNCKNNDCNLFYISCLKCEDELHGCCTQKCKNIFRKLNK